MQIAKAWIAIVFMVAVARADGPGQSRGEQADSVDPARYASDALDLPRGSTACSRPAGRRPRSSRRPSPIAIRC